MSLIIRNNGSKHLLTRLSTCLINRSQQHYLKSTTTTTTATQKSEPIELKKPLNWSNDVKLTKAIESKEEFKHVLKLLPLEIVPEPPEHASYPTPSGWQPPNYEKAKRLPYAVLRTRFQNFPIYLEEREGGSRKLVRIKNIQGDIWAFDKDLRAFIETELKNKAESDDGTKEVNIYSQVNEVQRHVLVKGFHHNIISKFLIHCGF